MSGLSLRDELVRLESRGNFQPRKPVVDHPNCTQPCSECRLVHVDLMAKGAVRVIYGAGNVDLLIDPLLERHDSPSGSGFAALTADATDRTVGDAADTSTTPSGVSADPKGAQS